MNKLRKVKIGGVLVSRRFYFGFWGLLALVLAQLSCLTTDVIQNQSTPTEFLTNTPTLIATLLPPVLTNTPALKAGETYYVDGANGSDLYSGAELHPWQSIHMAMSIASAGDVIVVRGGEYIAPVGGWIFQNSGEPLAPITFTNYPGEQVVLKIPTADRNNYNVFRCSINPHAPESWQTPKADYISIIGVDVSYRLLSNGVESEKGIVMQGLEGEQSSAIIASDCDYWEVAGVDFIETASAIFTFKNNWHTLEEHSADYWYVHDNRVYNFYRESGMQFNGNFNLIENNEIYKVSDRLDTPYGCQMLNLLGNNNIVRGNILSRLGSTAKCLGLLFEWDLSDANLIEKNTIYDVYIGIAFQGGDTNIVQNNIIIGAPDTKEAGIHIASYENQTSWPCNDYIGFGGSVEAILPPEDSSHPDSQYYYNPRNCRSMQNRIINNQIIGFRNAWVMSPIVEESNAFLNNTTSVP